MVGKVCFQEHPAFPRFRALDDAGLGLLSQCRRRHVQEGSGFVEIEGAHVPRRVLSTAPLSITFFLVCPCDGLGDGIGAGEGIAVVGTVVLAGLVAGLLDQVIGEQEASQFSAGIMVGACLGPEIPVGLLRIEDSLAGHVRGEGAQAVHVQAFIRGRTPCLDRLTHTRFRIQPVQVR